MDYVLSFLDMALFLVFSIASTLAYCLLQVLALTVGYGAQGQGVTDLTGNLEAMLGTLAAPVLQQGGDQIRAKICGLITELQKWSWIVAILALVMVGLGMLFTPVIREAAQLSQGQFGKIVLGLAIVGVAPLLVTFVGGLFFTGGYNCP